MLFQVGETVIITDLIRMEDGALFRTGTDETIDLRGQEAVIEEVSAEYDEFDYRAHVDGETWAFFEYQLDSLDQGFCAQCDRAIRELDFLCPTCRNR
jgi:hypothetical protein